MGKKTWLKIGMVATALSFVDRESKNHLTRDAEAEGAIL